MGTYDTLDHLRKQFISLYDDVDFLQELRQNGYKTGIVTNAPTHIVNYEISLLGRENFDAVVIARISNGLNPKPHPEGIINCLNLLKIQKNKAVYVGNLDEDVIAAKNAGVFEEGSMNLN